MVNLSTRLFLLPALSTIHGAARVVRRVPLNLIFIQRSFPSQILRDCLAQPIRDGNSLSSPGQPVSCLTSAPTAHLPPTSSPRRNCLWRNSRHMWNSVTKHCWSAASTHGSAGAQWTANGVPIGAAPAHTLPPAENSPAWPLIASPLMGLILLWSRRG